LLFNFVAKIMRDVGIAKKMFVSIHLPFPVIRFPCAHAHGFVIPPLWGLVCHLPRSANGAKSPSRVRERTGIMKKMHGNCEKFV